ncbi:Hypothetical protein AT6N2_L0385 [Agrobacterium tumefaciens]|nr:Hypothetical protein AT6N2_L0385 [Agrobacterium tumefaciens]
MDEDEVGDGGCDGEAKACEGRHQLFHPQCIVRDSLFDKGLVADRSSTGSDSRRAHVERAAHPVQRIDDGGRAVHPANAQGRETVDLREGAGHHHIVVAGDKLKTSLIIVLAHIFGISRIQHQQNVLRQVGLKTANFGHGNIGSGGVAWVGDEHHLGLWRDGAKDRIDIDSAILFLHRDRGCTGAHDLDLVDEEAVLGDDRLIARAQIDVAQQAKQFVRTIAAHDIRDVETMDIGNCLTQRDRLPVRINFQMARGRPESFDRLRARPKRRFVGRELINLRNAVHMFLAGNISGDIQNTRTRNRLAKLCTHLIDLWKNAGEPGNNNAGGIRPEWALCRGSARLSLACRRACCGHALWRKHGHENPPGRALCDGQSLIEAFLRFHHDDTGK